ncbi:MAG TPA: hypothetical protein VHT03_08950 [Rhizomicrobium sp.]|jgi:uncharacterized protein YjlB|nr:hypothetical protein [Rhizomicrobium sp.]
MPVLREAKRVVEKLTGYRRPDREALSGLVRARKPTIFRFIDDGETPNNEWPLVIYRSPVRLAEDYDPAAIFEELFALHGWKDSWRDGVYDFLHFHTHRHEVLGFARGRVEVAFGGAKGKRLLLKAGDVAILPAGTGHKRIEASGNLLVVGAYPQNSGAYDQPKPSSAEHQKALRNIAAVPPPKEDPVYGLGGPLIGLWQSRRTG